MSIPRLRNFRWFEHRILEHKGLSIRTKLPLSKPQFSAIRDHSRLNNHLFTNRDFSILTGVSLKQDLLIAESILIKKMRPELNNQLSAYNLSLI